MNAVMFSFCHVGKSSRNATAIFVSNFTFSRSFTKEISRRRGVQVNALLRAATVCQEG
ncbi:MAG: hypothetical protein U0232_23800 [Thermomicrobiales bacterium]